VIGDHQRVVAGPGAALHFLRGDHFHRLRKRKGQPGSRRDDRGLFAFSTEDEAVSILREINGDYAAHCRAARDVARAHFDSDRVLADLCRQAGL